PDGATGGRADPRRGRRDPRSGGEARSGAGGATAGARGPGLSRSMSRSRRVKDRAFRASLWACGFLALLPLAFIVWYVLVKGVSALNLDFFTKEPAAPGEPGGGIV